jgi:hypothetical protein
VLRTPFLAFPALGTIRCPLLRRGHLIIKDEIDLLILKYMEVIIKPEVMGNIHPLRTGQAIGTGRAVKGKHFLVRFRHLIDQSQLFGGEGIGSAFLGVS